MARTYHTHAMFIPDDIYEGLKRMKAKDRRRFTARLKALNPYVCEILDEVVRAQDEVRDNVPGEVHPLSGKRITKANEQRKTA